MTDQDKPVLFTGTVQPEQQQFDAWVHQPLLASIEQGGIKWPSSCRAGHCYTCMGTLESGEVRYPNGPGGLTDEDLAQGVVLPCIAQPCSNLVLRPLP